MPLDVVNSYVDPNEVERPFSTRHQYVAFVDPSGGTSDSMPLAIGHREKELTIIDVVRGNSAPFDPESADR